MRQADPLLLSPLQLRGVKLKNRIVISPMQQYAAEPDALPGEYHTVHYGRLALVSSPPVMYHPVVEFPAPAASCLMTDAVGQYCTV